MKKVLALSCAVVVLFAFSGYDWGNSETNTEVKKPAAAPAPAPSADPVTALNSLLGSGTPAERQAKLDTLVRLSQMMPVVAPQGVTTAPAAQATTPAPEVKQTTSTAKTSKVKTSTAKKSSRW